MKQAIRLSYLFLKTCSTRLEMNQDQTNSMFIHSFDNLSNDNTSWAVFFRSTQLGSETIFLGHIHFNKALVSTMIVKLIS